MGEVDSHNEGIKHPLKAFCDLTDRLYNGIFANLSPNFTAELLRKRWEAAAGVQPNPAAVTTDGSAAFLPFIGTAYLHHKEVTPTVRLDDSAPPPKLCHSCAADLNRDEQAKVTF